MELQELWGIVWCDELVGCSAVSWIQWVMRCSVKVTQEIGGRGFSTESFRLKIEAMRCCVDLIFGVV